ncbi:MAG: VWA domain-containing protein [Acidobacteria bacterium]|nr:VWA domain-containing protein [Acidobacteriota bacterium]
MKSIQKSFFFLTVSAALTLLASFPMTLGQREAEVSGVVTDQDGKPIAGALVGVLDQLAAGMKDAKTDAAGKFRVTGLNGGAMYRVVVTKYGYDQATLADMKASAQEIRVQLKRDEKVVSRPAPAAAAPSEPDAKAPEGEEPAFTLSIAVEEVLLNISVEDASGRRITDLAKEDFQIYQDGVAQEIKYFGHENVPISVVLLIDTSGSMEGSPLVEAKVAALAFLNESRPRDAVSLVSFNDKVEVIRPFTSEMLKIRTGVHSLASRGGTALYDALSKAVDLMETAPHPRHVIVLLSDGKDEDSRAKFAAIDKKIQASDVVLFSIGEYAELDRKLFMSGKKHYKLPELDVNLNPIWVLRYFADLSGGRAYFPKLGEALEPFFSRIARELHQQYVVTYQPTATTGKDRFHTIEVRAKSSRYPSLKVRTRKGYLDSTP